MNESNWNQLRPLLIDSCVSLLSSADTPISYAGSTPSPGLGAQAKQEGIAAFIGFAGEHIKGSLGITMPFALLDRIHPLGDKGAELADDDLQDWTGELANQLLGRLKGRLLPRGLAFQVGIPMSLIGMDLRAPGSRREGSHLLVFRCHEWEVCVQLVAFLEPGIEIGEVTPVKEGEEALLREGEARFFDGVVSRSCGRTQP